MTHIITLAEGYSDALRLFEGEMHGRIYADGHAKLRVRELKLYTCSINLCGRDEFLSDLYGLSKRCGVRKNVPFKWGAFNSVAKLVARSVGGTSLPTNIKPNPVFGKPRPLGGINYNAHFLPLCEIPDYIDKHGCEQV